MSLTDRYPQPPPKPAAWQGWRRKRGSRDGWAEVPGATGTTKGQCYQRLMELSELVAGEGTWEFVIWPAGQQPAS